MSDIIGTIGTAVTTFAICTEVDSPNPWINLLISVLSAVVFAIFSIGGRIIINYLQKKNIIDDKTAKEAKDTLDDLTDDGKINHSNIDNHEEK